MKRSGSSRARLAALVLSLLFAAPSASPAQEEIYVAWISFHEAYEAFVRYPSSENAAKARAFLPEAGSVSRRGLQWERDAVAYVASNLDMLEREVEARNREAVRLAFRLGAVREEFVDAATYMILGKLIRIDPQLFLEELQVHEADVRDLQGLVSSLGPEYEEREQGSCLELARRIGALESVESEYLAPQARRSIDALLRSMRARC